MGSGVYLEPETFKFRSTSYVETQIIKEDAVDSELYPEYYRKMTDGVKNVSAEVPQPFCIGMITEIKEDLEKVVQIKVRKFYRPENTHKSVLLSYQQDLNLLYWSDEGNPEISDVAVN